MNNPDFKNPLENQSSKGIARAEYDPKDVWDNWLVENYGAHGIYEDEEEDKRQAALTGPALQEAMYENAVEQSEGEMFDPDGTQFGSFSAADGELIMDAPENIPSPKEMEKWMDGSLKIRVDHSVHFQVDGPNSEGHLWQTRLFDQVAQKEVPNSRVLSHKLSYAIGAVMKHLPTHAEEYMPVEHFLLDTLRKATRLDKNIDMIEAQNKRVAKQYPNFRKRDLLNEVMDADETFSEIFLEGTIGDYVKKNIEMIKKISDADGQMNAARKFKKDFARLEDIFIGIFKSIDQESFDFRKSSGEDAYGTGDDRQDEGDGWMTPPDWRG